MAKAAAAHEALHVCDACGRCDVLTRSAEGCGQGGPSGSSPPHKPVVGLGPCTGADDAVLPPAGTHLQVTPAAHRNFASLSWCEAAKFGKEIYLPVLNHPPGHRHRVHMSAGKPAAERGTSAKSAIAQPIFGRRAHRGTELGLKHAVAIVAGSCAGNGTGYEGGTRRFTPTGAVSSSSACSSQHECAAA